MAQGVGLSMDTSFLNKLETAETAMQNLIDKSNTLGKATHDAFSQITKSGVVSYVQKLEQELTTLNSITKSIGKDASESMLALKKDVDSLINTNKALAESLRSTSQFKIEAFSSASINAGNALVDIFKNLKTANDTYLRSLEERFNAEQTYQQRQQSIKSAREQETKDEIRRYQQILDKIRELEKVQNDANKIRKLTLGANDKQGINTWFTSRNAEEEALTQLKYYREEAAKIEQKHEAETLLIKQQNTIKEFNDKRAEFNKYLNDVQKRTMDFINSATSAGQGLVAIFDQINKAQADLALKNFFDNSVNRQAMSEKAAAQIQATEQNRLVRQNAQEAAKAFSDRMKVWEEGFRRQEQEELKAYNEWLELKHKETQKHKEAEEAKTKATIEAIDRQNKAMASFIANQQRRQRALYNATGDSSQGALNYTKRLFGEAKTFSLNNAETALQKLQEAQKKLNLDTEEGRKKYERLGEEITRVKIRTDAFTKANENVANSHKGLLKLSDQLMRKFALVFSVSQITGYINKLAQVRGEFELQKRALQSILQDKDAADKLWQQTVDLAVRSPFRVGELVKYTKQLAAYRIETDKLHDTTKRLADISAGLGVDMSRLILAYGQVRAAEYLRGTELRQFTEAGIPLLDELAKHFTELEGRAVSTADVFGMISKRMVAFEDVAAVFQKMTDAGGVFYNMQEIQADTLKGMISNLYDSIDLMLNDIGKANDGVMKGMVSFARDVVENWREIATQLKHVIYVLGVYKVATIASNYAVKQGATNTLLYSQKLTGLNNILATEVIKMKHAELASLGMNRAQIALAKGLARVQLAVKGVWLALKSFAPMLVISVIYEAVMALTAASRAANELKEELEPINTELGKELDESISTYAKLTTVLKDSTKSYSEQEEAMQTLQRTFKDILPDQYLEIENIRNIGDNYDRATAALKNYYNARAIEQKRAKVKEMKESDISDAAKEFVDTFMQTGARGTGGSPFAITKLYPQLDKKTVRQALNEVIGEIQEGNAQVGDLMNLLIQRLEKYYGIVIDKNKVVTEGTMSWSYSFSHQLYDMTEALNDYQDTVDEISGLDFETKAMKEQSVAVKEITNSLDKQKENIQKLKVAYSSYYNLQNKYEKATKNEDKHELAKKIAEAKKEIQGLYSVLNVPFPTDGFNSIVESLLNIGKETNRVTTHIYDKFKTLGQKLKDNPLALQFAEDIEIEITAIQGTEFQQQVKAVMQEIADKAGVTTDIFDKIKVSSESTTSTVKNDVKTLIEEYTNSIAEMQKAIDTRAKGGYVAMVLGTDEQLEAQIANMQTAIPLLQTLFALLGGTEKESNGTGGKGKDWWLEMVKGIQSLHKEFLTLNKDLDDVDAKNLAIEKHKGLFEEIKNNLGSVADDIDISSIDFTNENAIKNFLKSIKENKTLTKETKLAIEKAISDIEGEAEIRLNVENTAALERTFDDLFGNYEMSLELEKLNIPPDLARQLFGIESIDLSDVRKSILNKVGLGNLFNLTNEEIYNTDAFTNLSSERQKAVKDSLEKEEELERKAQEKRLKKYVKYLQKAQDERVKIKLEELRQIAEVEKEDRFSSQQKEDIKKSLEKETKQALNKQAWKDFTGSDFYIEIFKDMENVSTKTLEVMRDRLISMKDSMKENLKPEDMKAIVEQIEKIDDKLRSRQALEWKIGDNFKGMIDYLKNRSDWETGLKELETSKASKDNTIKELADEAARLKHIMATVPFDSAEYINAAGALHEVERKMALAKKESENIDKEISKFVDKLKDGKFNLEDFDSGIKAISSAFQGAVSIINSLNIGMSEGFQDTLEFANSALVATDQMVEGFTSIAANPANIGGYIQAIQGIASMIGAIFDYMDDSLQREIDSLADNVERLEKYFERLEKAIERTFTGDESMRLYNEATANIQRRIAAYKQSIQLEKAKKKSDKDEIKGYQDAIDDLEEQLVELQEQKLIDFGGIGGDYKSVAEDFIDAWYNAFQETGDGIKGLEESFDELLQNVVKKQMLMRGMEGLLRPVLQAVDAAVNDSYVTEQEWDEIHKVFEDSKNPINEYLKGIYELFGMTSSGELSELQKGIQSINEPQAAAIEAYLNSMRFFVSDSNSILKNIHNSINVSTSTPIMSELKAQTQLIRTIDENLSSVIGRSSTAHQGAYIKVLAK